MGDWALHHAYIKSYTALPSTPLLAAHSCSFHVSEAADLLKDLRFENWVCYPGLQEHLGSADVCGVPSTDGTSFIDE